MHYSLIQSCIWPGSARDSIISILQNERINFKEDGSFLLHYAVCMGTTDIVRNMIQKGADVNVQLPNGISVLHRSIMDCRDEEMLQLLLKHGADVSVKDLRGNTPLLRSCTRWQNSSREGWRLTIFNIYKLLLESGASCNEPNEHGITPFLAVLNSGNMDMEIFKLSLDHGADVRAIDSSGRTGLHWAAMNHFGADMIEILLDQGLNVDCQTEDGRTALHLATFHQNPRVCEVLLRRGAMINIKDDTGETPLTSAIDYPNQWMMEKAAELRNVFMQQAAIMNLNSDLTQDDLRAIEKSVSYNECYQQCLQELERMSKIKFYNNVSILNVLTESKVISRYARNGDLLRALEKVDCQNEFPIYFRMLKEKLDAAVKRLILQSNAATVLNNLFGFNDPFHIVNQKVISYLRDEDLKTLVTLDRIAV